MKNLKILAILMLVVAVSYFLFMVSGKKGAEENLSDETLVESANNSVEGRDDVPPSELVVAEKSFASWVADGVAYKSLGVQTVQHLPKSVNYPDDGETLLIFGDYQNGTMSVTFPGKRVEKFIGMKAREPYFEPMLHYGFYKEDKSWSYTNTVDITGDAIEVNITRFDEQFIEGTFSGILTNLEPDGYHYENKINVTDGVFKVDLSTHPLKEIQY